MRIGINALYFIPGGVGGTEIYLRGLLAGLAAIDRSNDYIVYINRETGADLVPKQQNFVLARQQVWARRRPVRILWEQSALPRAVAAGDLDVLLNPGFTAPIFCRCPMVTVFHDLQHLRHPEFFRWFDLPGWRLLLHASARRSALLIAVSEATAGDLLHFYGFAAGRVRVIHHGVDREFFRMAGANEPRPPALLTVSTLHPHKNLDTLLRAFARFRRMRPEYRLVLAGLRGFSAARLQKLRDELGLEHAVTITGWIARGELFDLYAQSRAFIYPSLFEGFGMPVLEALAAGLPTACSEIEPLMAISGGAALYFDPRDEDALIEAIDRVTHEEALRSRLSVEGPRRAAEFTWETTAQKTLTVLEEACAGARVS